MDSEAILISMDPHLDRFTINPSVLTGIATAILSDLGIDNHELSIHLTDGPGIKSLNRDYRQKDRSTDVLSFPQIEFPKPLTCLGPMPERRSLPKTKKATTNEQSMEWLKPILGDLIISLDDAAANAERLGQGLDQEVCFLMVHGLLHLCGHDHINLEDEAVMIREQQSLMAALSSAKPPCWQGCVEINS